MIDPSYALDVPRGFDDADEDTCVHPIARKLFLGTDNSTPFARAQEWIAANPVRVADLSWDHLHGEAQPYCLSLYFTFETDDEDDS